MTRLRYLLAQFRTSLWLVPGGLTLAAIVAAAVFIRLDVAAGLAADTPAGLASRADGARTILATVASSIATVAGVAFSITIVALVLTASQYSSRVLRNFMRDRTSQVVLGLLVGTFAYCLLVLGAIRTDGETAFVPSYALGAAIALALAALGAFVYFIHHIATAIQASSIAANVAAETVAAIDVLFPESIGQPAPAAEAASSAPAAREAAGDWTPVPAVRPGYLQHVDEDDVLAFARDHDVVLRLETGIGGFIVPGAPLVSVAGTRGLDEEAARRLRACFTINRHRTIDQDAAFGIRQLVDVALKALSPGVNDTTTAVTCVDWLSVILARLAGRRLPAADRHDRGVLRVIARVPTFGSLVGEAFAEIRQNAAGNAAVLGRLLTSAAGLISRVTDADRRAVLRHHAELVLAEARRSLPVPADREAIEATALALDARPR
ncbi:MAG: DUF2254 domain-containing protein [Vicinamibacterales bacterium]